MLGPFGEQLRIERKCIRIILCSPGVDIPMRERNNDGVKKCGSRVVFSQWMGWRVAECMVGFIRTTGDSS